MKKTIPHTCPKCGGTEIVPLFYGNVGSWDANPVDQSGKPTSYFGNSCFCDPCRDLHCLSCNFEWADGFLSEYNEIYETRHFWEIVSFILKLKQILWADFSLPQNIEERIKLRKKLTVEDVIYLEVGADIEGMISDFEFEITVNKQSLSLLSENNSDAEMSDLYLENINRCEAAINHCKSIPENLKTAYPELACLIYKLSGLTEIVVSYNEKNRQSQTTLHSGAI